MLCRNLFETLPVVVSIGWDDEYEDDDVDDDGDDGDGDGDGGIDVSVLQFPFKKVSYLKTSREKFLWRANKKVSQTNQ